MEQKDNSKRKKLLIAAAVIVVVAAIGYAVYRKVYDMLFGGAVAVSIDDVYSTIDACKVPIICIVVGIVAAIAVAAAVGKREKKLR